MGIYLQGVAARSRKLGRDPQRAIRESAARWARKRGLEEFFYAPEWKDPSLAPISIYPPGGVVWFSIGDEQIDFGTKTSIDGPGYHLALVDCCDHLQRELDLVWRWDADGDSSGYAQSRSRDQLYEAYLEQLRAQCEFFRDHDHEFAFAMNLEIGLGGDEQGKVTTPMGSFTLEEMTALASADEDDLTTFAHRFYPWWVQEIDGEFWTSTLRAMLWTDARWRKSDSDWENHICRAIASAAMAATRASKRLPADLEVALADHNKAIASDAPPPTGEIGYRRRERVFDLTGDWKLRAPGYYYETMEGDDNSTVCIWHPASEEIRATSLRLTKRTKNPYQWSEGLQEQPEHRTDTHRFRVDPRTEPIQSDPSWRIARAECVVENDDSVQLLLLSVTSPDNEAAALKRLETLAEKHIHFQPEQRPDKPLDA